MKKDNRIFRPEQMNENDKQVMNEALDSFFDNAYGKGAEERIAKMNEEARKNNPYLAFVDGKWVDTRYYKGK